jgi:nucleoside-diphosphate-sugar epimerase
MRILIVGGNSTLGKSLKHSFSGTHEVLTAGRAHCDIVLDLSGPFESWDLPEDFDVLIHTAAVFGGRTDEEILATESINVLGTLKLCTAAARARCRHFILISSIFSVSGEEGRNHNIYALSKRHAEEVAGFYCSDHSLPLTILRPSQLYGTGNGFRKHQPFFYTMVDKAEKGEDITLYGSRDPRRNYIYIDDLTDIIVKVVEQKVEGIYPCTQTVDVTYSQIADAAFGAFKKGGKVCFSPDKPDIPDNVFEKNNSLYERINFFPKISIEEGLKRLANERISRR